jgi:hypothetical protein
MCTLICSFQEHDRFPFLIAANRDESLTRPATGPRRWQGEPFVAPRDEQARGTWLGLTQSGMFVGVTNRFLAPRHEGRESRGTLVVEALRARSARELHERLYTLSPHRLNAFHLLYVDATDAFVTWSDGEVVHQKTLDRGLHIVTERSLGGDDHARSELIRARWPQAGEVPTPAAMQGVLALGNAEDPLGGVCVEAPGWNYGTRSSLVLLRGEAFAESQWWWADGRPDRTPFIAQPELIAALSSGEGSGEGR